MLIQVLFAFLMLCGVTALYVDLGMARLAQIQMQSAADAAALEGLRYRDAPSGITCREDAPSDPEERRRWCAAQMARLSFEGLDPDYHSRLRPEVSGGTEDDLAALQLLVPGGDYVPNLQPNLGDLPHGDMVAGEYDVLQPHSEGSDYIRDDFTPLFGGDAFLVRLRRTPGINELDDQPEISSTDLTIPYLFGRATTMQQYPEDAGGNQPRVNGITVRAVAIANAVPALRVGSPQPDLEPPVPGITNIAISVSCWNSLTENAPSDPASCGMNEFAPSAFSVGQSVSPAPLLPEDTEYGYLPIFDSSLLRVVAFGAVSISGGLITRLPQKIASQNATAVGPGLSHLPQTSGVSAALLVPTLSR